MSTNIADIASRITLAVRLLENDSYHLAAAIANEDFEEVKILNVEMTNRRNRIGRLQDELIKAVNN